MKVLTLLIHRSYPETVPRTSGSAAPASAASIYQEINHEGGFLMNDRYSPGGRRCNSQDGSCKRHPARKHISCCMNSPPWPRAPIDPCSCMDCHVPPYPSCMCPSSHPPVPQGPAGESDRWDLRDLPVRLAQLDRRDLWAHPAQPDRRDLLVQRVLLGRKDLLAK